MTPDDYIFGAQAKKRAQGSVQGIRLGVKTVRAAEWKLGSQHWLGV